MKPAATWPEAAYATPTTTWSTSTAPTRQEAEAASRRATWVPSGAHARAGHLVQRQMASPVARATRVSGNTSRRGGGDEVLQSVYRNSGREARTFFGQRGRKTIGPALSANPVMVWCREGDLNPHGFPHTPLKRTRLPVPPSRPANVWCRRWDLNPHGRYTHGALNTACLPVPPLRHEGPASGLVVPPLS